MVAAAAAATGDWTTSAAGLPHSHGLARSAGARRLLVAALQAFADHGYHATTTRDIAAQAGMSPAGVYIHYPSKEDLLYRITLTGHQDALQALERAGRGASSAQQRLAALVRAFARRHAEHHTVARVSHYEMGALTPEHRAIVADLRRRTERIIQETIADGVRDGAFSVPDVPGTALAILSLSIDIARWFQYERSRSADQVADLYAQLALRMLSDRSWEQASG
jgi:AcrR family transcriptional regulator